MNLLITVLGYITFIILYIGFLYILFNFIKIGIYALDFTIFYIWVRIKLKKYKTKDIFKHIKIFFIKYWDFIWHSVPDSISSSYFYWKPGWTGYVYVGNYTYFFNPFNKEF